MSNKNTSNNAIATTQDLPDSTCFTVLQLY